MNKSIPLFFGTFLVGTLACATLIQKPTSKPRKYMNSSLRTEAIFEKTKTVCFGRMLIDVPATAAVIYGPAAAPVPTAYFPDGAAKIDEHVATSMAELEKDRMFLDPAEAPLPLFGTVVDGPSKGQRLVFGSKHPGVYAIHSYTPVGPHLYLQYVNVVSRYDDAIRYLGDFSRKIKARASNEAPNETGFCIEGGFIPGEDTHEEVSLGIRFAEYPDVHFSVSTHKNGRDLDLNDNLEAHIARGVQEWPAWSAGIKYLRQGTRQLGPWKGFEALGRIPPQQGGKEVHEFHFLSVGLAEDSLQPRLDVQMDTGASEAKAAAVTPSVSDEEALNLWDRLMGSMRVRPTTGSGTKPEQRAAVEHLQRSGAVCSQPGWWQCADTEIVAGGRRQYFEQGQLLPSVMLAHESTFWQKLTGKRHLQYLETVWRFVEEN